MERQDWRFAASFARNSSQRTAFQKLQHPAYLDCTRGADRGSLLLGTALAAVAVFVPVTAPTPAQAVDCFAVSFPPAGASGPINAVAATQLTCVNTAARTNPAGPVIQLSTNADGAFVRLDNTGKLTSDTYGVIARTAADNSAVTIVNSGDVELSGGVFGTAIFAYTRNESSPIDINNSGDFTISIAGVAHGIFANTEGPSSRLDITNSGYMRVETNAVGARGYGIRAYKGGPGSAIEITNSGDFWVTTQLDNSDALGIVANNAYGPIDLRNSGDMRAQTRGDRSDAFGLRATTSSENGPLNLINSGGMQIETKGDRSVAAGITAEAREMNSSIAIANTGDFLIGTNGQGSIAAGIYVDTSMQADSSHIDIRNSGDMQIETNGPGAYLLGIRARSNGSDSPIDIDNSGDLQLKTSGDEAPLLAIAALGAGNGSPVAVRNSGNIMMTTAGYNASAFGIYASGFGTGNPVTIHNSGDMQVEVRGDRSGIIGIYSVTTAAAGPIAIQNSGDLWLKAMGPSSAPAYGIRATTIGANSRLIVSNSGDMHVETKGEDSRAFGIYARTFDGALAVQNSGDIWVKTGDQSSPSYGIGVVTRGANSPINIVNSGSVFAEGRLSTGIYVYSFAANKTTIMNTGEIGAQSHLAIDVKGGGNADIFNAGHITGFVDLTSQNDKFVNQAGGIFETKKTSLFGGGSDLFDNQSGGTVQAATSSTMSETSAFEGLETFRNRGLISMIDGQASDSFRISNTPGGTDLNFQGGGQLGLDVFLDGAASPADTFTIEGNVSGTTTVVVNNTNGGPGTFNPDGIPVIFVTGSTPSESNFQLAQPIDTGLFDYDLFLVQTGSGFWELRSFPGGSAQALPKLLTAAQDMWHQTSATWFDRTADLRVVLNGGSAPGGAPLYNAGSKGLAEPGPNGLTPAVWMKGGGSRLDRDSSATTSAYGRTYTYDLDNEFSTFDLQVGVDMGQYDVISQGDVLIFGVLGGFVGGKLDYDSLGDTFDFSGGQVGAYATYLKDGLFVDTLLNVHLYEINTPNLGFPDSLDATTVGLRTDAGYRFGSFTEGLFFEPLATIEVTWADIDGFSVGGNRVSFSDDANVRGRIGGRVGTTMQAWEGTTMEPFLIASLWGNLSEDNSARLVSSGTTFNFNDDLDDVWGEISGGVNLFNFSQTTSVFAKVDYTFGEDVQGVGGKAGVRAAW